MAERKTVGNLVTSAYLSILVFHVHTNIYKCIEFHLVILWWLFIKMDGVVCVLCNLLFYLNLLSISTQVNVLRLDLFFSITM